MKQLAAVGGDSVLVAGHVGSENDGALAAEAAGIVEKHMLARAEAGGIDEIHGVIENIGVAVPGLGITRVDGGEAGGVRCHPAGELGSVLAELGVVEGGFGVALPSTSLRAGSAGEFVGGDAGVSGVELAPSTALRTGSGRVVETLNYSLVKAGDESGRAEMILVHAGQIVAQEMKCRHDSCRAK
jgi:hypothetical protein